MPGRFAVSNGKLYYSDTSGNLVFDTATATGRAVGITAPVAVIGNGTVTAAAGALTVGQHLYRYRYLNSTTGYVSDPSPAISKTMVELDKIAFSVGAAATDIITSATTGVDKILVEATTAAGATFYVAATVNNTAGTANVTLADSILSVQTASSVVYGDDGQTPMPNFSLITDHRSRIFGYEAATNLLGWSRDGFPEGWNMAIYSRKVSLLESGQALTAQGSFFGDLYLFTPYRMIRFVYPSSPTFGAFLVVPTTEGAWSQDCLIQVDGAQYGFGANGLWVISGMTPKHLSSDVDPFIESTHDITKASQAFAFYSTVDRSITWVYASTVDTYPRIGVTYSLRTGKWSTREYKQDVRAAAVVANQVYYSTSVDALPNLYLWRENATAFDGVANPSLGTVATGSTASVINTVEAMADYRGLSYTLNGQTRTIIAWATNQITLDTALASVPATGLVGVIGAVEVKLTMQWQALHEKLAKIDRPVYWALEVEPAQSSIQFEVTCATNFGTPITWTRESSDTAPSGITFTPGSPTILVSAAGSTGYPGYAAVPLSTQGVRTIQFTLQVLQPMQPFGLLDFYMLDADALRSLPGAGE
jgi:hypothetical protein